ncbi:hypothetical protein J437_LFUL010982 [Ladona fulva]|uniref:Uncharacterized protein n=1 Tax=Ladona fulva TaxID=123851 RepID=A0A8K0KJ56_LADFU|nr:hypothetical protein J437_LFUL010982 [Ladona fulva]
MVMSGKAEPSLVPTKCTQLCQNKRPPFQAVVHEKDGARLPVTSKTPKNRNKTITLKDERPELDMKRVRYEVMKFSSSNLRRQEREQAEVELAVSLGAMPPKRKCINYKELLQKRKEAKETEQAQNHAVVTLKKKLGKRKERKVKGKKATKKGS